MKATYLPRMTEAIFALLRKHDRFWSAAEIKSVIAGEEADWTEADIETTLNHHCDCKRFARVPGCDRCNPLLNISQTCRHAGSMFYFKILVAGVQLLEQHEKRQPKLTGGE